MAVNYSTIGIICLSVKLNLHWHALCGIVKTSVSLGYFKLLRTTDKKSFLKYWMTETPTNCKRGGHPMSFQDKSIQCSDCGDTFTFSAEDQEFFQSKAIPRSRSAVPRAVRQGSRNVIVTAVTEPPPANVPRNLR